MNPRTANAFARARGMMLMEIIVAIALVSVTAAIATQLLWTALGTTRDLQSAEQSNRTTDRLAAALRRDVERAATLQQMAGKIVVGDAEWSLASNGILRKAGPRTDTFVLPESTNGHDAKLWTDGGRVYLRVTGDEADATLVLKPIIGRGDR